MIEISVIALFCIALFSALLTGLPILWALVFGLILFLLYGKLGFVYGGDKTPRSWKSLAIMCWNGVKTAKGILLLFVYLGLLTSIWRAAGTIPYIVSASLGLIQPSSFIAVTFLLNAAMSLLTGTALGTAATMGVICATMGRTLDMDPVWMGGAILAGVYFGNRLSPISSMALLTANISGSDIYKNIRLMLKTTWLPLLLSCVIYVIAGFTAGGPDAEAYSVMQVRENFAKEFTLSHWSVLPAIAILVLSIARIRTSIVLLSSSAIAFVVALLAESQNVVNLFKMMVWGYKATVPELSMMINGGGLLSMLNVFLIVVIAGCYGGLFKGTGLLSPMKNLIERLSHRTTPFVATLVASSLTACVVCNQTLTIVLTHQMTESLGAKNQALNLYDSAVVVIALVPWSVATAIVLATAQTPASAILCACFLYLLPLCRVAADAFKKCVGKA
ncbi:transporter, NhaC family [Fibrobacter sp. UWT3]|uniref:Na+/H+ antiporter NhaC family protein n=1 Tax=Fibrobacter sp. UWT3 TaxID=1896225 RepID=UPI000BC60697|nr:Na+/H+ antiporter NhaC family protein [Fibrobacter sp. UWT3]SOE76677.1 transporter, NhaC family [Fibrobacter sp. UWT3]